MSDLTFGGRDKKEDQLLALCAGTPDITATERKAAHQGADRPRKLSVTGEPQMDFWRRGRQFIAEAERCFVAAIKVKLGRAEDLVFIDRQRLGLIAPRLFCLATRSTPMGRDSSRNADSPSWGAGLRDAYA